jgi:hypothetical protein
VALVSAAAALVGGICIMCLSIGLILTGQQLEDLQSTVQLQQAQIDRLQP